MFTFHPARIQEVPLEIEEDLPAHILELNEPMAKGKEPIHAKITIIRDGESLIANGTLETTLDVECGRCGKWIKWPVRVDPFVQLLDAPLPDTVDLTPLIREDILLDLPAVAHCPPVDGKLCRIHAQEDDALVPIPGTDIWKELDKIKTDKAGTKSTKPQKKKK
ncbi:uncharacterized protein SAMN05444156_3066 [Verrucomicrobium sp. GAS474]|uniref:YceD family protein n=1 Tax=Verrucomicrobium sp. GAS474 TaxID=1882831 RepID=UPI0008797187|nr:hypothetical protein [Verrucomicrobium sp. GAS474]SDU28489.1 uncharacterized protein SAMN05444156_3066 [Verrucomicrobium sp. GAS474]